MEDQIFTWDSWDLWDTAHFAFFGCTLICDFGPLKEGEKYATISINFGSGELTARINSVDEDPTHVVSLQLAVKEEVR